MTSENPVRFETAENKSSSLPRVLSLSIPLTMCFLQIVMSNSPNTHRQTHHTSHRGDQIRTPITLQPVPTIPHPIPSNDTMPIVDPSIHQIEEIAKRNRRQSHGAPVLTQAGDSKRLDDQSGVDTEEDPVGETGEAGDETERVRSGDGEACELGEEEKEAGDEDAPEAGEGEALHDDVGAYAAEEAACEGHA